MKDKSTKKSRGFGYITMKDSMIIENILKSQPLFIEGKQVDCKIAIPKDHINENIDLIRDLNLSNNSKKGKEKKLYSKKIMMIVFYI